MSNPPLQQPYSPEFAEAELGRAGLARAVWRAVQLLATVLAAVVRHKLGGAAWLHRRREPVDERQRRQATWLLGRIVWLGPAFVKLGQSLATRPDLLPLTYIQVLSQLYDQLPPFADEVAFAVVEEELGWRPETLFRNFEREPFAAASLGQVYRAVTFGNQVVAVKIQRPGLQRAISLDLALLRRLAALVERRTGLAAGRPWTSLLDEFGAKLFEELDYIHEAHLTERFRAHVAELPGIDAPGVHWELTSRHVLTTDFVSGIRLTDRDTLVKAGVDIPALLSRGVRANLKQLFEDGFFHADPHPGNLLVRPEDGTLVFLDFGMMGIIGPDQKERIVEILVDVINRRPDKLRENLIALGCLRPDSRWDELLPLADRVFRAILGDQERTHTFQEVTSAFAPLIYEYDFRIPLDFAYIARALLMLEGISRQLDPDFDIFAVSAPYAARMMLTSPSPSLRRRLMEELVTPDGRLDYARLGQIARLAARDGGFAAEAGGLLSPAIDLLLSPEGDSLRSALIAELLTTGEEGADRAIEGIASLLTADATLSGRQIVDRVVAFLLSAEGSQTRRQIEQGLRRGGAGGFDLAAAAGSAARARRLHPAFGLTTVLTSAARYLLSGSGQPARRQILASARRRLVEALLPGEPPVAGEPAHGTGALVAQPKPPA